MKHQRKVLICLALFSIPFIFNIPEKASASKDAFHSLGELRFFEMMQDSLLPEGFNSLFAGSGECFQCHGFDTAGVASLDFLGNDINVVDDWRATMMANSAKDPFWRAQVSHEVLLNPQHQVTIETKCTSCHAPLGHFAALHDEQTSYSIAQMLADSIAFDGVSCLACHQQSPEGLGYGNSGNLNFDTMRVAFGQYESPLESPMVMESTYKPEYSLHIQDAGLCAGCHTLITETLDLQGNTTGNYFVEQATYHEWLNSSYNLTNVTCQECHMNTLDKEMVFLIAGYETEGRFGFALHELVGANTFMLRLMRDNIEELGITATADHFNEIIAATEDMLQNQTLDLSLSFSSRTVDTTFFELNIHNRAGHKFPSGYPSRLAFVEFLVTGVAGDTIFHSGKLDSNFELIGQDLPYEQHHNVIRSDADMQIYEMVMADANGDVTTVLLRGHHPLKDNRLPPEGFTTSHMVYDTTLIAGQALSDPDFNFENEVEGSGSDIIHYHVPMNGNTGMINARANIYYQVAPPRWMEAMFNEQSPEIDQFEAMFNVANRTPEFVSSSSLDVAGVTSIFETPASEKFIEVIESIPGTGRIRVKSSQSTTYNIFDETGKLLGINHGNKGEFEIHLPDNISIIIIQFVGKNGNSQTEKFIP